MLELEAQVRSMLASMDHRGPSGGAVVGRAGLVMAVNRLAIREIEAPCPPLIESEQDVLVACNGEIDNHRELRSSLEASGRTVPPGSDIAVIGPLYLERGQAFLDALQGVFAVALWDAHRKRLVLARDRAGERHLHYAVVDGVVYFASELAALLRAPSVGRAVDAAVVGSYLLSGYCAAPGDPVEGCRKVQPGEAVVFDAAGVRTVPFWTSPLGRVPKAAPSREAFDLIFRDAVSRQTDVDVEYGVLLSGGVDSALITAVARDVRPERALTAYCARFAESTFDEGQYAAEVANRLGCRFVPINIHPEDIPDTLRDLIESTGELLADPAWVPHALVARRAADDVPMLLGGEGADELFGGYPTYLGANIADRYGRLPAPVRSILRRLIERLPVSDRNMTVSFMLKQFVQGEKLDGLARHVLWKANIAPALLQRLGVDQPALGTGTDGSGVALMDSVQRYDFTQSLPEALLAKADRGGMRYGVEVRAPFLDREVIEFAATLPISERVHGMTTKVFLKNYARRYLPRSVVNRRKRGLSVPLGVWLRGPLHAWARSRLAGDALQDAGVDKVVALRLLSEHCFHRRDHAKAIWTLAVLSEWLEWRRRLP